MTTETPQQAARRFSTRLLRRGFKPIALHVYEDAHLRPVYWRVRLKHPRTQEKWIRPLSQDETGHFQLKEPVFSEGKPLYHLPELVERGNETVWIVEGELCVDRLGELGLLATTSGSADSAAAADWGVLAGRTVTIWPDHDEAGARYAQVVAQTLLALGCLIKQVDVATLGLSESGDCVDWLLENPDANKATIEALPCVALHTENAEEGEEQEQQQKQKEQEEGEKKRTADAGKNKLPCSFSMDEQGVFYHDAQETRWVCSELAIKALVRDNASENWGRLLEFSDADGTLHTWAMPMEMLKGSGEELRGELLRLGLEMAPGHKVRNLLVEYITTSKPDARVRCVTRTGWHGNVFVFPHGTLGPSSEKVIYQSEGHVRPYAHAGTLADWQKHISALCVGNTRLLLAVSCVFAALVLHPAGVESGGLHLVGESSCGKTTALRVAASVYGGPDYLHRWRATTNGLEALATLHSDTLLVLDELSQVDPRDAGEIAYMLANGSGKSRAAKSGAARPRHAWRLLFLSAGEMGLAQHIQDAGKKSKAGQAVRLVDVPADAGKELGLFDTLHHVESAPAFSNALMEAASQYYGVAASHFLTHITRPDYFNDLQNTLKERQKQFMGRYCPAPAGGQVHRVCERFALIAAAGELASDTQTTGWPSGEATRAVAVCFQDWLAQRGSVGNQEATAFLAQVQAFFEAHGASRFEDIHAKENQSVFNRVGFKEKITGPTADVSSHHYFVLPEMFKRELCQGFDPRWGARVLIKAGMLQPSPEHKAQTAHRLPGEGLKKCYHFIRTVPEKNFHGL